MSQTANPFALLAAHAPTLTRRLATPAVDEDEAEAVRLLLDAVRTWAARNLDSAKTDREARVDPRIYRSAAELGLFGLTIPSAYGGAGFSLSAAARIVEELAIFDRSVATGIGLHCGLGLRGLIRFGSEALRERFLPPLARGDSIAAFAATESEAGSHIAGVKTTGTWDGGDLLSLSGGKIYVTNGGIADLFTILARTPNLGGARRGYSILLLDREMKGLAVGAEEHKLGIRGSSTTTLAFDEVAVPVSRVIGEPGKGLDQMNEILAWGRTLMTAGCLGTARAAFTQAAAFVRERRQFGKPIGDFGLVRQKVAEMRATLLACESLVRLTTMLQSSFGSDIIWESSVAKVFASEAVWRITDTALQLHGGAGYIEETGVARLLRDCRITRIFEGANEVLRFHVAAALLGLAAELETGAPPQLSDCPPLASWAAAAAERQRRLGGVLAELRGTFGVRVAEHQILLGHAADAAIGLFTLWAVLLGAAGELSARPSGADHLPLAELAAAQELQSVDRALTAATRADDEARLLAVADRAR